MKIEIEKEDVQSIISMLKGTTERIKIVNYIKKYLLNDN